jgi:hypothetical protein
VRGSSSSSSCAASASSARSWLTRTTPGGEQGGQPRQAVVVEVVGRLVERDHVEARGPQRREPRSRGLPARQRPEGAVEQRGGQAQLLGGGGHAGLGVGAAEREPALQRGGVRVDGGQVAAGQPRLLPRHGARRAGHADALEDHGADGRRGPGRLVGELRQVADGAEAADGAAVQRLEAGQRAQQRRLPRAVGADDRQARGGVDADADVLQDGAVAVVAGDAAGVDERRGHAVLLPEARDGSEGQPRRPRSGTGRASSWRLSSERHACDGPEGRRPR